MLIFTNCLTDIADEGCVKTANSLVKRIKAASQDVTVVSYERKSVFTDAYVSSNKFLLTKEIVKALRQKKEDILYIPFPAKSISTAIRLFILSFIVPQKLSVLLTQVTDITFFAKILFKLCGADFWVLSADTQNKLEEFIKKIRVKRIKTGVQSDKFVPVTKQKSIELKNKYGFSADIPVILHVGHLNRGRNISELMRISHEYQILLVTSTLTKSEQDLQLKEQLLNCPHIRIIDDYIPDIEEIYQLSDVYFFPVCEKGNCIDVPLSCLEAASCNKPVVTTDFGEMKEFRGKAGFFFIESFDEDKLNSLIDEAVSFKNIDTRSAVLEYDWSNSINTILNA